MKIINKLSLMSCVGCGKNRPILYNFEDTIESFTKQMNALPYGQDAIKLLDPAKTAKLQRCRPYYAFQPQILATALSLLMLNDYTLTPEEMDQWRTLGEEIAITHMIVGLRLI